jgi:hypothetical protein
MFSSAGSLFPASLSHSLFMNFGHFDLLPRSNLVTLILAFLPASLSHSLFMNFVHFDLLLRSNLVTLILSSHLHPFGEKLLRFNWLYQLTHAKNPQFWGLRFLN